MSSSGAKPVIKATDHPNSTAGELPGLLNITLEEVAEGLQSSKFTSVDIVKAYLARIEESNDEFRSVIETNPDAVRAAELLDEERHRSGRRGYWHGVPILVKDNIVTQDRMETTSGSCALVGAKPDNEASVVSKFRKAGAVILGKTNLSEWANFRSSMTSNGWSPRGGQTMGTYYPKSEPSGSSAGSGVATSLGLCIASLGSETAGSIICPAEINCVVGLKPTRGLVANDGCVPISHRQDVVGPMTRTVRDAAHMLNTLAGRSEADDFTWNIPFDPIPDFTTSCQTIDIKGIKIGVPRNTFIEVASPILAAFEIALTTLATAGAEIIENTDFESVEEFLKQDKVTQSFCIAAEFKSDLATYFAALKNNPHNIHNMKDLITYTQNTPEEQYPDRDTERFLWTQKEGADVSSAKYKELMEKDQYFGGVGGILGALKKHNLDILAVPSTLDIPTLFAAKMGFPILSVPLGFYPEDTKIEMNKRGNLVAIAPGIPFCITFITKAFDDAKLLRVGYAFEQITKVRLNGPKPFKVPKTELKDVLQRAQKL